MFFGGRVTPTCTPIVKYGRSGEVESLIACIEISRRQFLSTGSRLGVGQIGRVLADRVSAVPVLIRGTMRPLIDEIRLLEARVAQLERAI